MGSGFVQHINDTLKPTLASAPVRVRRHSTGGRRECVLRFLQNLLGPEQGFARLPFHAMTVGQCDRQKLIELSARCDRFRHGLVINVLTYLSDGMLATKVETMEKLRRALVSAGVEFIADRRDIADVFDFLTTPKNWPEWHPASTRVMAPLMLIAGAFVRLIGYYTRSAPSTNR